MFENISVFEDRYKELEKKMTDPEVISNSELLQQTAIEHAEIEPIVLKYRQYNETRDALEENKAYFEEDLDSEMRELINEEVKTLEADLERIEEELKILLIPKDKNDDKNVMVEIRAGAGGDEAALFAGVLLRQYIHYGEKKGWKTEILSSNAIGIGGYKEVILQIEGRGAYSRLKYESGVHRVQRVPETESSGRIHTSTATVAVMPEIDDVEVNIDKNDLRIDTYRASGAGGQHVNMTDSAIRITHIPTGIVVSCQDEKSQHKNRDKAMKILKSRLYDYELQKQSEDVSEARRSQVGTGDRSERVRTYNYPQGRVTDHRINFTSHQIEAINDGELDEIIDALTAADQAASLENLEKNGE